MHYLVGRVAFVGSAQTSIQKVIHQWMNVQQFYKHTISVEGTVPGHCVVGHMHEVFGAEID